MQTDVEDNLYLATHFQYIFVHSLNLLLTARDLQGAHWFL